MSYREHHTPTRSPFARWFDALTRWAQIVERVDDVYAVLILVLVVGAVYVQTLWFDFTYFDDNVLVLENLTFLQDLRNIPLTFTQEVFHILHASAAYYRPILTLSFMQDAILSGEVAGMYHLTNILIHLTAGSSLYLFLRTLGKRRDLSLSAGLIFVVHPVLTQAVAWIPGRNDSLVTVFVLWSCIGLLRYVQHRSYWWYSVMVGGFALAIFTKETAVILPLMLITLIVIRKGVSRAVLTSMIGGFVSVGVIWAVLRHFALHNPIPLTPSGMVLSMITNAPAAIQLVGKVLFPFNLTVLPIIQDTTYIWGLLATLCILALLIWEYRLPRGGSRDRLIMMLYGLVWFGIFLFPSFIRPNPTIVADFIEHRLYLPLVGLIVFLIESPLTEGWLQDRARHARVWGAVACTVVCILFAVITVSHSRTFRDRLTFWQGAVAGSPHSPLAQRNLGAMYFLAKDYTKAQHYFRQSLELNPNEQMAHHNLGLIAMGEGKYQEAERLFGRELAVNPAYDNTHYSLGVLYYRTGRIREARAQWEKTLQINPDYTDALRALDAVKGQ